jgi:hypothetical protein
MTDIKNKCELELFSMGAAAAQLQRLWNLPAAVRGVLLPDPHLRLHAAHHVSALLVPRG